MYCESCGKELAEGSRFCDGCGAPVKASEESNFVQVDVPENGEETAFVQVDIPENAEEKPSLGSGNIIAGAVGAFLFALLGAALYFVVYQIGFVAGLIGLVTFIAANFGYALFAKADRDSKAGVITSVIMTVVMLFVAEYLCLSYEIYEAFREEYGITFLEAVRATPDFLAETEILLGVVKDLLISYALSALAAFSTVSNRLKNAKKNKA